MNPKTNPNAVVAIEGTSLAAVIVYGLGLAGVVVPVGVALLAAGAATVGLLWLGKEGLRSAPGRLWYGARWYNRQVAKQEKEEEA